MIKIFRNIRKKLLAESKASKYIIYALGEIVLVVIGILIALQVNNWNEFRKDRIKEQVVLQQLKKEYISNLEQLESKIEIRNILINSSKKILSYIDHQKYTPADSIFFYMSKGNYRPTYDPIKNDLITSNKLALIRNDRLRALLTQWESNVFQLNEEEYFWRDYCIDHRLPFLSEKKLTRKLYFVSMENNTKPYLLEEIENNPVAFSDTKLEINTKGFLANPKLEAILSTCIFSSTDANLISYSLIKYIEEILTIIEESLVN
jgi:hypothetical protein